MSIATRHPSCAASAISRSGGSWRSGRHGEFLHSVTPFPPRREGNQTVCSYAVNWVVPCACGGEPGKCKERHQSCSGGRSCVEQFAGRDLAAKVTEYEDERLHVTDWGSLTELQQRAKAYLVGEPYETGPLTGPRRSAIFMTGTRRGPSDLLSAPAGYGDLLGARRHVRQQYYIVWAHGVVISVDLTAVRDLLLAGDRAGAAAHVPQLVADTFVAHGDAGACMRRVAEYRGAESTCRCYSRCRSPAGGTTNTSSQQRPAPSSKRARPNWRLPPDDAHPAAVSGRLTARRSHTPRRRSSKRPHCR